MTQVNVAIAPDNNYAIHCAATMASVLANASDDSEVNFFILDGGLSEENKNKLKDIDAGKAYKIEFLKVDESDFKDFPEHGYISISTWYRIKLGSLLPEWVGRILYLDCDVIVRHPLDGLFKLDMEGSIIGTSLDCIWRQFNKRMNLPADYTYFNAGILLIDMNAWRKESVEKMIFDFLAEDPSRLKLLDQNVLNILLGNRKINLGIKWNFQYTIPYVEESCYYIEPYPAEYLQAIRDPHIIHYVGANKPWKKGLGEFHIFKSEYVKYLRMTPWRAEADNVPSGSPKGATYLKSILRAIWRKPALLLRASYWGCVKLGKMVKKK